MAKGVLVILDGYGEGKPSEYNAVSNANTPTLNELKKLPHSLLKTNGEAVGLFADEMGGSEVGHTTIGAGRIVKSTAKKIRDDIKSGVFQKNKVLLKNLNELKKNKADLHLVGLMSDKNIHSNINHCLEIVEMSKNKAKNIYIHFITDGRDCGIYDSLKYLKKLNKAIKNIKNCEIASVSGRFYAMDRENNLDRTNLAFNAMFKSKNKIENVETYLKTQHNERHNDQYIFPTAVNSSFKKISPNDCVMFFNFREDRLRQIVKKCEQLKCKLLTMADVDKTKSESVYPNEVVKHTLSEYLSKNNLKQVKISESTKYAHVTYFLNGGSELPFKNEDRIHVPTLAVDDFSKTPKMQAEEITKNVLECMEKNYDAIIVNYSNPDMIAHTGNYKATVAALEFLDKCIKIILTKAKKEDYFVMVTADHGNSEEMLNSNGEVNTAHTLNRVICVLADSCKKMKRYGELKDVAPTFIQLLGLKANKHFEGDSLFL